MQDMQDLSDTIYATNVFLGLESVIAFGATTQTYRARAGHPGPARHEVRQQPGAEHGEHQAAEETLPGLLRRQLDQWRAPKEESCADPRSVNQSKLSVHIVGNVSAKQGHCAVAQGNYAFNRSAQHSQVESRFNARVAVRESACRLRACQVGADVVDDDQRAGQQKPDDAVKDVGHEERGRHKHEKQDEVRPRVLPKLVQIAPLLQPQHERHKACGTLPHPELKAHGAARLHVFRMPAAIPMRMLRQP